MHRSNEQTLLRLMMSLLSAQSASATLLLRDIIYLIALLKERKYMYTFRNIRPSG